jgi:sec-independent protein translocase protein TatB
MEFLGVGPTEFIFIIIIALIVLGPKDLAKTGSTVGKWLNSVIHSDAWQAIRKTSEELRNLPTQLMREDNYEKAQAERKQGPPVQTNAGTWSGRTGTGTSPQTDPSPDPKSENTIHPPVTLDGPPAQTAKPAPKKSAATPHKKSPAVKKTASKPAAKTSTHAPKKKSNA